MWIDALFFVLHEVNNKFDFLLKLPQQDPQIDELPCCARTI